MKKWLKRNMVTLILTVIFFIGAGLIIYPSFADYWNSFHQSRSIMKYAEEVANMDSSKYEKIIESAREYNAKLARTGFNWSMDDQNLEAYEKELSFNKTGNMGYINIDKIHIKLPIYHGTDETILQTSIGHMSETSLPVGGESSHCVLSGHRGLPSAKLFTDLDKLVAGDTFTINILNETMTYEVDRIRVVVPTDLSDVQLVEGKDYCTLETCTPYGINTHRLLVRAHRIENAMGEVKVVSDALQIESKYIAPFLGAPILILLSVMMFISTGHTRRYRRAMKKAINYYEYLRENETA